MITKIAGKVVSVENEFLTLAIEAFEHEVLIPEFARRHLQNKLGQVVSLFTIEYLEGNPMQGRMVPRLVGFLSSPEREFFELFCQVDGVGVKKALRAMVRPVQEVATAIEEQDVKSLSGLPGIGPATAERIIAKLRRKVPKFALLVARDVPGAEEGETDLIRDAYDALRTLGHSESDARRLVDAALARKRKYKDLNDLLHAVYEQQKE